MSTSKIATTTPRLWHVVDAKNQVLGRLAPQIAKLLMGKHRPTFHRHVDNGDFVVVINAKHVAFTGDKRKNKVYKWHTGWAGGLKELTAEQLIERNPRTVIEKAVRGMMPPNKMRDHRLTRLRVFPDAAHTHTVQAAQSQRYAPGYMAQFAPQRVEPRQAGESGALVVEAKDALTPAQLAEVQKGMKALTPDAGFAAQYAAWQAERAGKAAAYDALVDARIWARAQELDAADAQLAAAAAARKAAASSSSSGSGSSGGGGSGSGSKGSSSDRMR